MYRELLDPLYLLSTPGITKGLGAIIIENLDPRSLAASTQYMKTELNRNVNNLDKQLKNSNYDDNRIKGDGRENNNRNFTNNRKISSKIFRKHGQQDTLSNGKKINQVSQEFENRINFEGRNIENEKNKDEEIIINFTQFFHLLLQISKVVYPEIYHGPRSSTQYKTHCTDGKVHFISGPSLALEKVIRVSSFWRQLTSYFCIEIKKLDELMTSSSFVASIVSTLLLFIFVPFRISFFLLMSLTLTFPLTLYSSLSLSLSLPHSFSHTLLLTFFLLLCFWFSSSLTYSYSSFDSLPHSYSLSQSFCLHIPI